MAHEIQSTDSVLISSANQTDRGWHGLGKPIPQGKDAVSTFVENGIDWGTRLDPIYRKVPIVDIDGFPVIGEDGTPAFNWVQLENDFMHTREDNNLELGLVGKGYRAFENIDVAKFADALAGADAAVRVETAGTLYNSRRVFVLVRLPQQIIATSEDISEQFVLISNGHGGFAGFSAYPTSVRVVCANTLRWSLRDAAKGLSFRHTGNLDEKIGQVRQVLGIAVQETAKFQEQVTALVNTTLLGDKLDQFFLDAYTAAFGKLTGLDPDSLTKATKRRDTIIAEQKVLLENSRNALDGIRGTAWSAFNAVTEWHDHKRGRNTTVEDSQVRRHSNLFGVSSKDKTKTLQLALSLV